MDKLVVHTSISDLKLVKLVFLKCNLCWMGGRLSIHPSSLSIKYLLYGDQMEATQMFNNIHVVGGLLVLLDLSKDSVNLIHTANPGDTSLECALSM